MKRDLYWDSLKFILIILVIYGHVTINYTENSILNTSILNLIYLFHIPLFVFVSGRFSHIKDKERYKRGIIKLLETYIVFQIIRTLLSFARGNEITVSCITTPNWILWYIVALIYWRLLVLIIPDNCLKHRNKVIIISIFVSISAGFIPMAQIFAIQRSLAFLPFFVLGYYSLEVDIKRYVTKIPYFMAIGILIVTFSFLYFGLGYKSLDFVTHGTFPYWNHNMLYTFLAFIGRCVFIPVAVLFGLIIMRLAPTNAIVAKWGGQTLFLYIYHSFAIGIIETLINSGYLPQNEFLFFVYAIIITCILLLLSRFPPLHVLLNPISYIIRQRHQK